MSPPVFLNKPVNNVQKTPPLLVFIIQTMLNRNKIKNKKKKTITLIFFSTPTSNNIN